jgi:hypothetical protein
LFTSKIDVLSFEKEKAMDTKKQAVDDLFKAQKQLTIQQNEIDTFNVKIAKLRQRRNVDLNKKLCQSCNKEYDEKENYNWSCCTHRSEWGGTMWWCCGKNKKTSPGCKFQKHFCKDDE